MKKIIHAILFIFLMNIITGSVYASVGEKHLISTHLTDVKIQSEKNKDNKIVNPQDCLSIALNRIELLFSYSDYMFRSCVSSGGWPTQCGVESDVYRDAGMQFIIGDMEACQGFMNI